jgi:signal transduction histidine kinase
VTLGIGFAVGGLAALLLRGIFVLVIVPSSLVSVRAGLLVATGAAVAHEVLLGIDRGFSWGLLATLESMVPVFLFFVVAQQCFFYAEHLKEKNKSLAELASRLTLSQRRLGGLVRVARTLNSTMESDDLLARVNQSALSELYADWSGTFLVDRVAKTFRMGAVSGDELGIPGETHADLPLEAWPVLERLNHDRIFMLEGDDIESGSTLTDGREVARFLVAGLYSDDDLTGFMALAYCLGHEESATAASEQLGPIAEHATIALRNSQLLDEARQASRLKSDFVSTMSHELRTPLNVIIGYSEMLRDGAAGRLSAEQRELFDQIDVQSRELYDLIEATLQVGRIETGTDDVRSFHIPMTDLISSLDSVTAQLPRPAGVAVEWETCADSSASLYSDLGKVNLILRNLVSNAFKFTKHGRVSIRIDAAGDELLLEVSDTGIGISPSDLPQMFEMFRQLDSATTRVHGGVGLGLYIVKQMVDRLGGRIDVDSAPGEGATFRVWLPGYQSEDSAVDRGAA